MKMNIRLTRLCAVLLAMLLMCTAAFAEIEKLTISQMVQNGNDVTVYVNVLQSDDMPVTDAVDPSAFSVSTNIGDPLPASVNEAAMGGGVAYTFCVDISGSVTGAEASAIRDSMNSFVGTMNGSDFARVIAMGEGVEHLCDFTQDPAMLSEAIAKIDNKAKKTYLYQGLHEALESTRKNVAGLPSRAAIIVFTDGVDDSDDSMSDDELLDFVKEVRIPVYVVGLKGNDPNANLSTIGRIARQSGGIAYSNNMAVADAVTAIGNVMGAAYALNVQPAYDAFGLQDIAWKVNYKADNYDISSANYIFSLTRENVVAPNVEPTPEPVTQAPVTAEPTPVPVTPEPVTPEPVTPEPVTPEPETAAPADSQSSAVSSISGNSTDEPEATEESGGISISMLGEPTPEPEAEATAAATAVEEVASGSEEAAEETTIVTRIIGFVMDYLFIIIAGVLVLAALLIVLIIVLRNRRHNDERNEVSVMPSDSFDSFENGPLDEEALPTIAQVSSLDDEATVANFGMDDSEATVAESPKALGVPLEFLIECEGQQRLMQKTLFDHIVLGRGLDCDVVLDSKSTSRQHAVIINSYTGMSVKDLGSRNKTYLNGNEIDAEMPLQDGDVLKLGSTIVQVKIVQ